MEVVQFTNKDRKLLKRFVGFAWDLYKDDPAYVPPLNMDLLGSRLFGQPGLLTDKHPFHEHAEVAYYLAYKERKIVGRIAACVDRNYNAQNDTLACIFGFFEVVEDYDVAQTLLDEAARWGRKKGMRELLGPMSFTTNHTIGAQIDAFGTAPYFETGYNPPYYAEFLDRYGLGKGMDVIAQLLPVRNSNAFEAGLRRFTEEAERAVKEKGYRCRPIDMSNLDEEKEYLREVYNEAWENNWGSVALTDKEFDLVAEQFRAVCDPDTTLLAFVGDEPVGLFIIMPDLADCIRKKYPILDRFDWFRVIRLLINRSKTKQARILMLGIKERYRKNGLRPLLVSEGFRRALAKNQYDYLEAGWLLETNTRVIRTGEAFEAKRYKTWRIYRKMLRDEAATRTEAAPRTEALTHAEAVA